MDAEIKTSGRVCASCGAALAPDDWFCRACGTVVVRPKRTTGGVQGASPDASVGGQPMGTRHTGTGRHMAAGAGAVGVGVAGSAATPAAQRSAGTVQAGTVNLHYEPEPEPSPVPRVLGMLAAVLVALGVGWWAAGGSLPFALPWARPAQEGSAAQTGVDVAGSSDGAPGEAADGSAAGAAADGQDEDGDAEPGVEPAAVTYELVQEALSWEEAQAWCEEHGGTLAQPHTAEELAELAALIKPTDAWVAWVGARPAEDGMGSGYVWLDGTPVAAELFDTGEPNNEEGAEDRLAILRTDEGYHLYDVASDLRAEYPAGRLAFVMERPADEG